MKKYDVFVISENNNQYPLFSGIDETSLNNFLNIYCSTDENSNSTYRWGKWIIRFYEVKNNT